MNANAPEEEHIAYMTAEQPKASQIQVANTSGVAGGDASGSGNLDKIRDILFGNQMRDYEKRFARLEERLVKDYTNMRDETRKRLDALEMYIQKEVESLTERVKNEQGERERSEREIVRELKELIKFLETKLAQLDEQNSTKERELRQQILSQSKSIDDQMRQKSEEILATLERETKELRYDKTDRSALAALFAELAMRLNN